MMYKIVQSFYKQKMNLEGKKAFNNMIYTKHIQIVCVKEKIYHFYLIKSFK